jgi:transposase-like protein
MSERSRRYHAPSQKADRLRQHHVDKVPISELCNQHRLQPSVFYTWQRHLWEHASQVFTEPKPSSREQKLGFIRNGSARCLQGARTYARAAVVPR